MNLVSIFSFKMPLQILYLSVGFKKHLSNSVITTEDVKRRLAEQDQLRGLQRGTRGRFHGPATAQPSTHHFPRASPYPSGESPSSRLVLLSLLPGHDPQLCPGSQTRPVLRQQVPSNQQETPAPENGTFSTSCALTSGEISEQRSWHQPSEPARRHWAGRAVPPAPRLRPSAEPSAAPASPRRALLSHRVDVSAQGAAALPD